MDQGPAETADDIARLMSIHQSALVRLARYHGADEPQVERAVIEAWKAALAAQSLESEAFRHALFTEVILRAGRLEQARQPSQEDAVEAGPFEPEGSRWANWFAADPPSFTRLHDDPEQTARAKAVAEDAVARLPFEQRVVVVLRDVAGWSAAETTQLLGIDPVRERVLLHAGRTGVRLALERLVEGLNGSRD